MNPQYLRSLLVRNDGSHVESPTTDSPPREQELFDSPAYQLGLDDPLVVEKLELLDDTVFEAIAGKALAVEQLRALWPEVLRLVGPQLVEESRQAYLHHALKRWHECTEEGTARHPKLAVTLMDVLAVLLDN